MHEEQCLDENASKVKWHGFKYMTNDATNQRKLYLAKKSFVSLSFIIRIITLISYCCFVSTSDRGAERCGCEFVLSPVRYKVGSFLWSVFSAYFTNQNIYLQINVLLKLLKEIV